MPRQARRLTHFVKKAQADTSLSPAEALDMLPDRSGGVTR